MKLKGYLFGCVSSATYGLIPLFALPMLRRGIALDSVLFYRFACAAALIGLTTALRRESLRITRHEAPVLAGLGLLFAMSARFLFWSYDYMDVGIASTLLFLYPVFVALMMALFFRERIPWAARIAIGLAFGGVFLLYGADGARPVTPFGVTIVMLSALSYALYMVVVNKSCVSRMPGSRLTFYALAFSALFFGIKARLGGGIQPLPDLKAVSDSLLLALIPTVVSCVTMVYAVHCVGSTVTAVLGAMEPLTAVSVGVLVFGETLTGTLLAGITLIVGAVTLIIRVDATRKKHAPI